MPSRTYNQGVVMESKATVVSIVPFPIDEEKPGLIPGSYHIDASLNEEPICLTIGDSFFYVYIDADRGNLRVPAPSYQVAHSICFDYISAQLEAAESCHPGIFWKNGLWTPKRVKEEAKEELAMARSAQFNWFTELVKRADDDWQKYRAHYAISDTQRYALRAVDPENSKDREWVLAIKPDKEVSQVCPACGSEVPDTAIICRFCQFVLNADKYKTMSFAKLVVR
jgi:hypothetical protein